MVTLVFVDTNILLDFYRLESREAGLTILEKLEQHREAIITGDQVAMEFKKNRQKVILDVYRTLKAPDWRPMQLPPVLSASKASRAIERHKKGVGRQADRLKKRLQAVLERPSSYDPVYRTAQKLFRHRGPYNLSRDKDIRLDIRELAKKRFMLGYPPRKPGDNSIGDAVNWEWIVHCASASGASVVVVTRDSDYGSAIDGKPTLNDWLREEFRARVGRKRRIILTDRLAIAFKAAAIAVTKTEEEAESVLIKPPAPPPEDVLQAKILEIFRKGVSADALLSGPVISRPFSSTEDA